MNKSRNEVPKGYHLHYDEHNSLENESVEFIFGRAISSPFHNISVLLSQPRNALHKTWNSLQKPVAR